MKCLRNCQCYAHAHAHTFNGPFSGTIQASRYQKVKINLDITEARDSEWQWHQLDHMQVCTSLQTDNHASTPPLSFTRRMPFLPPNQQRQSTEGTREALTANWQKSLVSKQCAVLTSKSFSDSTPPLGVLQAGCRSCHPTNSI